MSQANSPRTASAQPDLLKQVRKETAAVLFTVALLQFGFTGLLLLWSRLLGEAVGPAALALELGLTAGPGLVATALALWALSRPLPAASVGLGLLAVLTALNVETLRYRIGGNVIFLMVHLVLAALLVRSIRTCLRLRRASAPAAGTSPTAGRLPGNGAGGEARDGTPLAPGAKL
jgi:hypothetical protein